MFYHKNLAATFAMFLMVSIVPSLTRAQAGSYSLSKTGGKRAEAVTSLLWIEDRPPEVFAGKESMDNVERALFHKTQADLVRSSYVIDLALQQPGIMQMPLVLSQRNVRTWLQHEIFVSADTSSQLMKIGMEIDDPRNREQSLALVRAVTTAYLHIYHSQLTAQRQRESEKLLRALNSLAAKRRQIKATDRESAEANILNELWKDLYRRSVQNEANALAGPRVRLLKIDGLKQPGQRVPAAIAPSRDASTSPRAASSLFPKKR